MTAVIIYNSGSTQKPYSVATTVAAEAVKHDQNVTLLDVDDFVYIKQGLPPRWLAKAFGHRVYPGRFEAALADLGVSYEFLSRQNQGGAPYRLPDQVGAELENAIQSDLFTYLRTDRLDDYPRFSKFTAEKIRRATSELYPVLLSYFKSKNVTTVYIPNGRVAHQRLALLAANQESLRVKFYEIGRAIPNSAYIGESQVHDRLKTQLEARNLSGKIPHETAEKAAREWLRQRSAPDSTLNPFSKVWQSRPSESTETTRADKKETATFFTSSADEFSSYGSTWKNQAWENQFEGFSDILKVLTSRGVASTIRVHPALVNKSRSYVKREIESISKLKTEFPSLRVIGPGVPVSSYQLAEQSDYIIVGRSTIGLEASLLGKSVWTTTPARYDEVADVRPLTSTQDVTESSLTLWEVDPHGAEIFVSYLVSQDYPFVRGDSEWCSWDISRTPGPLKIGNLLLPNHPLHTLFLLGQEVRVKFRKLVGLTIDQ